MSEKPSIRELLADAKREYAGHKPQEGKSPVVICRAMMTAYEPKQKMAAGMGVLPWREWRTAVYHTCRKCTHGRKQSFRADLMVCPHYISKRSKICEDKGARTAE